ncbi:MAG: CPBP family intramembrane metalloprotease [Phycisphaerae bacterium]|jgi:membrane protease YdiL (CAAX protease family)
MWALGLLVLVPAAMWLGQTLLLWRAGLPLRGKIGGNDLPRWLRTANRVIANVVLAAAVLVYPLLRGASPVTYYARFLPLGERPAELAHGAAAAVLYLALLYLAWLLTGNVEFRMRHGAGRLLRRLAGVPGTAVLAALVEELLFRAMLLGELIDSCPTAVAVGIGALVFAGAHYVRSVKRYWTFPGHVALGLLLCVAFVATGGSLWLSMGLHGGGVLVLMTVRPLIRYTGPGWLVGASIFPYAGVVGVIALGLLTINMWLAYGVTP